MAQVVACLLGTYEALRSNSSTATTKTKPNQKSTTPFKYHLHQEDSFQAMRFEAMPLLPQISWFFQLLDLQHCHMIFIFVLFIRV
jgi:hypothetical protein